MRKILFRAKKKNLNEWIEGIPNKDGDYYTINGYAIDIDTLSQLVCIGTTTEYVRRNGEYILERKEFKLFDGDIIKVGSEYDNIYGDTTMHYSNYLCTYNENKVAFVFYCLDDYTKFSYDDESYLWDEFDESEYIAVIGNKWDNPDLINW